MFILTIKFIKQKITKITIFFILFALIITPSASFAKTTLGGIEEGVLEVLKQIPSLLIGLAGVFFLWSVVKFIKSGDNEEARAQGKFLMTYGIIAIVVMVSLWGVVGLLRTMFDIQNETTSNTPVILTPQ